VRYRTRILKRGFYAVIDRMKTKESVAEARTLAGLHHPCVIAIYGGIIGQISVAGFRTSEISGF
jgi:hypothetical protein